MRTSLVVACLTVAVTAHGAQVFGRKCAAIWDTGTAAVSGTHLDCTDGDPTCDTDGAADHTCTIAINACVDTPAGTCTPQPLKKLTFTPATLGKLVDFVPPIVGPTPTAAPPAKQRSSCAPRSTGRSSSRPARCGC
jgi:hypothetical protein